MKCPSLAQLAISLPVVGALLLSGCATRPEPIYYWGDKGPEEQIASLEAGMEKARATGKPLPPGYQAHLGVLYALGEKDEQMRKYFEAEKTQFPESAAYMDFLLRKFKQKQ
jgi:hypothetical protein